MGIIRKIKQSIATVKAHKEAPLRVEFILTDYCKLRCRGCTHYSPLAPKEFAPLETLGHAMEQIGCKCGDGLAKAYLMGGETLLYPHLEEAMDLLRRHFPTQELHVFTSGINLPTQPDSFWEALKRNRIILSITRYPVKFDYDALEELCRGKGAEYEIFGDRSADASFFKFGLDPEKKQNGQIAHFRCFNRGCISVVDDKVYPCSVSACVRHLNASHGTRFVHEPGDYILVDDLRSADDLRRLRDHAVPFCSYCRKPEERPYGPSKGEASEWM